MKLNVRRTVWLTIVSGACAIGTLNSKAATSQEEEATAMMSGDPAERAAAMARAKDPAWKPSCTEVGRIQVGDSKKPGALKNFCLNAEGNLLACYAPASSPRSAPSGQGIRIYSPKGELLKTWPLDIRPAAVCMAKDGTVFVAGDGKVLKLDPTGKVLASVASPVANEPVSISKEMDELIEQSARRTHHTVKEERELMKANLERRRADVTGLAVTDQDLFMAVPAPNDFTYRVYRVNHALENPKLVVEKLRGCCGQMDIQAHEGKLWIPHNARHQVECHDRDGAQVAKFGTTGRVKANDFGGCCEPKNLRVLANGDVLAAESGPPTCIKRFSASGKFIEVVAVLKSKGDCVRVTVEVSPDKSRYYLLDTQTDAIRIFGTKS